MDCQTGRETPPDRGVEAPVKALPDELVVAVYEDLRRLAAVHMRSERRGHTLAPTALVHEAYARLARKRDLGVSSEAQLMALAAIELRRVLVDHAREKKRDKRGGGWERVTLSDVVVLDGSTPSREIDLLEVDGALRRLEEQSSRMSRVVELRMFGGLTIPQTALVLGVSERTVVNDWTIARARLRRDLSLEGDD